MPIQDKLAYSVGRKDQLPNRKLAQEIVESGDPAQIKELIAFMESKPSRRPLMDAALTLAYISECDPEMMVVHIGYLLQRLDHEVERVGWGSMIALAHLVKVAPDEIYEELPVVLEAMKRDSIVGRDHGFRILVELYAVEKYREDLLHIILEQLAIARPNQLGQYTERFMGVLAPQHASELIQTLEERKLDLTNPYHEKRLTKNLKKLYT